MEVEIVGFKNYKKANFSFPNGAVTLLRGNSGSGKTTVLQAIKWCLYGKLRGIDPKNGKGKLYVKINTSFGGEECEIYRQKRPNSLRFKVGILQQADDVAQERINEIFGSETIWDLCSYIEQESHNKLFQVPGSEKLKLLNQVAFHETDPSIYIQRIEERLKEDKIRFEILQQAFDSECEMLKKFLTSHKLTPEDKRTEEELNEMKDSLVTLTYELSKLREQERMHHQATCALELLETRYDELKSSLQEVESKLDPPIDIEATKERITRIRKNRYVRHSISELINKVQALEAKLKDYENFDARDEKEIYQLEQKQINYVRHSSKAKECDVPYDEKSIKDKIIGIGALLKIQPALKIRQKLLDVHKNITALSEYKTTKEELDAQRDVLKRLESGKDTLKCPHCDGGLRYIMGKLETCDHHSTSEEELSQVKEVFSQLQISYKKTLEKESLINQFNQLKVMYEEEFNTISPEEKVSLEGKSRLLSEDEVGKQKQLLAKLQSIETGLTPIEDDISDLKKGAEKKKLTTQLEGLREELDKLRGEEDLEIGEETDESELEKSLNLYIQNSQSKDKLTKELETTESQLNSYKSQLNPELGEIIKLKEQELETLKAKTSKAEIATEVVQRQSSLQERREELVEKSQRVYYLDRLKTIAIEVECKVLQNTVNSINATINALAEKIFVDPIRLELKLYKQFKSTKKIKPSVNIEVHYNGCRFDSIYEISGGERSRVSLLLTLALNRLSGSPVLMLDETFHGLDSELKHHCLNCIKAILKEKMVLCVVHESTAGYYDKVIDF
jgi:exonuclease SbcC